MTLLITVFAAVICTAIWYETAPESGMMTGILCWIYWGASLMWFADAVFEYFDAGADYFNPGINEMINDAFLGMSVVALGLVIWVIVLLVKDPKGVVKMKLFRHD